MTDRAYDVTTVGECLLRISIDPGTPLADARQARLFAAGAESNVAAALGYLGRRVAWASRLPDNPPGRLIASSLRQAGVDLSMVEWCASGRVGTFFVELAASPAPVRVTYDRENSCASEMTPETMPIGKLLDTRLIHVTGITPALSTTCRWAVERIVAEARAARVPYSFDVNYRRKLWPPDEAKEALLPLARGAEILFIAESDAAEVFGIAGTPEAIVDALRDLTAAEKIVLSVGNEGVIAWDGVGIARQPAMPTHIIDRLGAGDALAAGVIHGWLENDFHKGLQYGTALAGLCLRRHGDIVVTSVRELVELLGKSTSRPLR